MTDFSLKSGRFGVVKVLPQFQDTNIFQFLSSLASFFTHSFPLIDKYNRREYADEQCADNSPQRIIRFNSLRKDFAVTGQ